MSMHTVRAISGLLDGTAYFGPIMMDVTASAIARLEEQRANILDASNAIVAAADEDERELSDDELATIDANTASIAKFDKQIEARKALEPVATGRKTAPEAVAKGERKVPAAARDTARHGFHNMGEFAKSVRAHASGSVELESVRKLTNAATTYGNEGSGADGGFLVPPEFASMIWKKVEGEENLMSRCTELTPSGNSMTLPKDETTPWGTSGIQAYWESEAATASQTKAVFESSTLRLYKLMALAPVTDELLEDSSGFESWIAAKVPSIIAHKINTAIVSGTGAGQPLGILNSASLVSVAKETSQPADTVWFANINKMWSRMYAPWRRNAVWLINQDIEPSLHGMAFQATGASSMLPGTSAVPAYLPMNGLSSSPYATLMGRPVVPVSAAKTVGDQGDIILVDLKQYWVLRKAAGLRTDTSMHLYFDQAVTAFRFIFRINGQPAWSSTISPENGSNTLSWAVALDAR
jgi:HK97 family phage major capsid protein